MPENLLAEFRRRFPHASEAVILRNADLLAGHSGAPTELERGASGQPVGAHQAQTGPARRFRVCVCSVRRRLLDPDNICAKWGALDALRKAGIIPDDSPQYIDLDIGQRKTAQGEAEHTEIRVYEIE